MVGWHKGREELGYKGLICEPLGCKDLNDALKLFYNTNINKFNMEEDEALEKARNDLFNKVERISQGLIIEDEDGNDVCGEDNEPIREKAAQSILEIEFEAWKKSLVNLKG